MTISDAVSRCDAMFPSAGLNVEMKISWLSELDRTVKVEIYDTHKDSPPFDGYTADTAGSTELLVPPPYDEMYIYYLQAKLAYVNGELAQYNNAMTMFNELWGKYARKYNREHRTAASSSMKYK